MKNDQPKKPYTFSHDGKDPEAIKCKRCTQRLPSGAVCARRSCFTLPVCWQHLKQFYRLRVDRTTLRDDNGNLLDDLGLFACDARAAADNRPVFVAGAFIVPYIGEVKTKKSIEALDAEYPGNKIAPYAITVSTRAPHQPYGGFYSLDSSLVRGAGSLANTCRTSDTDQIKCRNNARIDLAQSGHYPNLVATHTIHDGDEIFVHYGADGSHPDRSWKSNGNYTARRFSTDGPRDYSTNPHGTYARLRYKPCS